MLSSPKLIVWINFKLQVFLVPWYSFIGNPGRFTAELRLNMVELWENLIKISRNMKIGSLVLPSCNLIHRHLKKQFIFHKINLKPPPEHPSLSTKCENGEKYLDSLLSYFASRHTSQSAWVNMLGQDRQIKQKYSL